MKQRTGHLFLRGKVYWLQYRIDKRNIRQSLGTSDLKPAEQLRKEIMRPLMAAGRLDALAMVQSKLGEAKTAVQMAEEAAHPPLAVADAWREWTESPIGKESSDAMTCHDKRIFNRFSLWLSEKHPAIVAMREVSPEIATEYGASMATDQLTASTFNQHLGFLRRLWTEFAKPIRATVNPWMSVRRKKGNKQKKAHRRHAITPEQFNGLLAAASDRDIHDLLFVLGMTGQRLVDGVMLRWDSIDFHRKVISLTPRKTARTGKEVFIPLFPALADLIRARRAMVKGPLVFPELAMAYDRDPSAVSKHVMAVFEKAGLTTSEHRPGIARAVVAYGAHSLRHFFATQALASGIPAEVVKRITGHSSDAMLEGYEHLDAALVGKFAAQLGAGASPEPLALPAPPANGGERFIPADVLRALANNLTAQTWRTVRDELFALLEPSVPREGDAHALTA